MHNDVRDMYREEILEHYRNPHNFGELPGASVVHEEHNPLCGDRITLQLRLSEPDVGDKTRRVVAAMFTGEGCAISTASASIFTDYLKGKSIDELKKLSGTKLLEILGLEGLSPARLKCALLPLEALKKSLGSGDDRGVDVT